MEKNIKSDINIISDNLIKLKSYKVDNDIDLFDNIISIRDSDINRINNSGKGKYKFTVSSNNYYRYLHYLNNISSDYISISIYSFKDDYYYIKLLINSFYSFYKLDQIVGVLKFLRILFDGVGISSLGVKKGIKDISESNDEIDIIDIIGSNIVRLKSYESKEISLSDNVVDIKSSDIIRINNLGRGKYEFCVEKLSFPSQSFIDSINYYLHYRKVVGDKYINVNIHSLKDDYYYVQLWIISGTMKGCYCYLLDQVVELLKFLGILFSGLPLQTKFGRGFGERTVEGKINEWSGQRPHQTKFGKDIVSIDILRDNLVKLESYRVNDYYSNIDYYDYYSMSHKLVSRVLNNYPFNYVNNFGDNYLVYGKEFKGISLVIMVYAIVDDYYLIKVIINSNIHYGDYYDYYYKVDQVGGVLNFLGKLFSDGIITEQNLLLSEIDIIKNNLNKLKTYLVSGFNFVSMCDISDKDINKLRGFFSKYESNIKVGDLRFNYNNYLYLSIIKYEERRKSRKIIMYIDIFSLEDDYYCIKIFLSEDVTSRLYSYKEYFFVVDQFGELIRFLRILLDIDNNRINEGRKVLISDIDKMRNNLVKLEKYHIVNNYELISNSITNISQKVVDKILLLFNRLEINFSVDNTDTVLVKYNFYRFCHFSRKNKKEDKYMYVNIYSLEDDYYYIKVIFNQLNNSVYHYRVDQVGGLLNFIKILVSI